MPQAMAQANAPNANATCQSQAAETNETSSTSVYPIRTQEGPQKLLLELSSQWNEGHGCGNLLLRDVRKRWAPHHSGTPRP